MRVTAVEIDPRITLVARERFFLDRAEELAEGRLELVNGDGWKYLRGCGRSFDVIVNDAFSGRHSLWVRLETPRERRSSASTSPSGACISPTCARRSRGARQPFSSRSKMRLGGNSATSRLYPSGHNDRAG